MNARSPDEPRDVLHGQGVCVAVGLASMGGFLVSCAAALLDLVDVPVALLMIAISLCGYVLALASSVSAGSSLGGVAGSTFHSAAVSDNEHRGGVPHAHMQRVR